MSSDYDQNVEEEIPGEIYCFAVIDDEENEFVPPVISHENEYELPEHFVRERQAAGGACTYALLRALESMKSENGSRKKKLTWADALKVMHGELEDEGGRQSLPTLTASRPINVHEERLRIVSSSKRGTKRALLVGTHYQDEENEDAWLASCHTDVRRMRKHLIHVEGFEKDHILVLMDDDRHHEPTKDLILDALERMCQISEPGDSIFFLFSGHGGTLMKQEEYEEEEVIHELLTPGNFRDGGLLMDDEFHASFVTKVPEGVHALAVIDTCHPASFQSGKSSAIDLPYVFAAGDEELRYSEGYRPGRMLSAAVGAGLAAVAASLGSKAKKKKKDKKKKNDEEEDEEEMQDPSETYDNSYNEASEGSGQAKSKKKKKKKKKEDQEDHSGEGLQEEKPKKKKKKPKKKSSHD